MDKSISTVIQEMKHHRNAFMKKSTPYRQLNRAIKQLEKLENIEKIITKYQDTMDNFYNGKPRDLLESDVLRDIKEVLKNG
ncbi:MAG: hypothetical protein J6W35_06790 [Eubacterium sp.]|nr:hypothetical protein [Eubacterium sp.]